jgi:hypothetical protein
MDKWEKFCPIEYISLSSEVENIVMWWTFKLNRAPTTAGTWDLSGLRGGSTKPFA